MAKVPNWGMWGTRSGIQALEEFYYIFRDEIPESKFYWPAFFQWRKGAGEEDSNLIHCQLSSWIDSGKALIESLRGNTEFCGTKACVAGWACATHPHLIQWVNGVGIVPTGSPLIKAEEELDEDDPARIPIDDEAFAVAFGITQAEAHGIIYGYADQDTEDEPDEEPEFETSAKERALERVQQVLADHGIQVHAQKPAHLA
jgi:hypothetical protein